MRRIMRYELNRRAFLGMSAAAGAALVAGASLSACSDADLGWLSDPSVSFTAHILPVFLRLADICNGLTRAQVPLEPRRGHCHWRPLQTPRNPSTIPF